MTRNDVALVTRDEVAQSILVELYGKEYRMSLDANTALIESAQELINDGSLSSTPIEPLMIADVAVGDLESLRYHYMQALDMLREE